ncbi:DUF134 domain-containing protein [Bacteroidetes/Chlorobi group bacterium ChocPot_Mid]|jgi:predicted DNA-binding protein (UPF0251 family)|nr:MAG: DUF134 domain-containing protein [Bacteroidetes/Chlorobi group bacterium ChocPot_Mid]
MPRPHKCRRISSNPDVVYFKPAGLRIKELEEISLTLDEYEAIRLADYEGLYQENAAEKMNISRQTFGNIINSAHQKIADFLLNAKVLVIKGGVIEILNEKNKKFRCKECNNTFKRNINTFNTINCPRCKSSEVHQISLYENFEFKNQRRKRMCKRNREDEDEK